MWHIKMEQMNPTPLNAGAEEQLDTVPIIVIIIIIFQGAALSGGVLDLRQMIG